jgi:hypothetical protein
MTNDIAKRSVIELDGFEGYDDSIEGSDTQSHAGLGLKLKYLAPLWTDPNGTEVRVPLVALDVLRRVQKWIDSHPVETETLGPGEQFPDIEARNASCPQSEWRDAFGKRVGPWQAEHVVLFFDPDTMLRYWWPSPVNTVGSTLRPQSG